jgi:glycosyltransferase involved in cell wall biosynthesis
LGSEFFEERGFNVFEVDFSGWGPSFRYLRHQYKAVGALRSLISEYDPIVIHIHSATLAPVVKLAARAGARPTGIVTTFPNEEISEGKQLLGRNAARLLHYPFGHRVIAISEAMAELIATKLRISRGMIRTVACSADEDHFRPPRDEERTAARQSLGLSEEDFVACCVGRLVEAKNQEVLVRAAALLRASDVPVRIVLAGERGGGVSEYQRYLANAADELGVRDAIEFPGDVDSRSVYWASDVNVLPSVKEGFGLVIVEGMLCGTLAVRSPAAGAGDQIEDQRTGFLIDPYSPESVASALAFVHSHRGAARRVCNEGRRLALERYTLDRMAEQVVGIYDEAVECAEERRRRR